MSKKPKVKKPKKEDERESSLLTSDESIEVTLLKEIRDLLKE